jgi:hypothetical protein
MVKIVDYKKRQNTEGKDFFTLGLMGDLEFVLSGITGNYYATAFKGSITTTFNEDTCKSLVGRTFPGTIERIEVDPYDYKVPETGETVVLTHKYRFTPQQKQPSVESVVFGPEAVGAGG